MHLFLKLALALSNKNIVDIYRHRCCGLLNNNDDGNAGAVRTRAEVDYPRRNCHSYEVILMCMIRRFVLSIVVCVVMMIS
jgi:hypothetical protein